MSVPFDLMPALTRTFILVRAYNEGQVIGGVVSSLCEAFPNIVVVNDGSSDDTATALRNLPVKIVTHLVNLGAGAAMQTGLTYALDQGAEYIITFDADGQHRIEDALAVLQELYAGKCDVVYGSRFLGQAAFNIPRTRKLVLKAAARFSNLTTGTRLTDAHNGLRGFNRRAALSLDITQSNMAYASEITSQLVRHKMNIHEVPVQIIYTEYSLKKGQSSLNSVNILIDLVVGRFLK
jgi:glycosyltransferase involved in cell wall biosynthesis